MFGDTLALELYVPGQGFYANVEGDINALNAERAKDSVARKSPSTAKAPLNSNAKFYFDKLKELAAVKHIQLYFLYLPSYGNRAKGPASLEAYKNYGTVLLPPDSIVCDARNFSNFEHLNRRGAVSLSLWLKQQLETDERPKW